MKREILFRGKRVDNGEWVEGDLVINKPTKTYRIFSDFANVVHGEFNESGLHECSGYLNIVMPETVGQFTGLTDKNGKRIFEGDILGGCNGSINGHEWKQEPITITFEYGWFNVPLWAAKGEWDSTHYLIVIGNIHDNPELQ